MLILSNTILIHLTEALRRSLAPAAIDTRVKAAVTSTMYDMSRANAKGYFDAEDSGEARYQKRKAMNAQKLEDYRSGTYAKGGSVAAPVPENAPFFVKDYYNYYKTDRGYHMHSLNSNDGWMQRLHPPALPLHNIPTYGNYTTPQFYFPKPFQNQKYFSG